MAVPDEEEFDDFLSKVNDVEATIKGLMSGEVSLEELEKKEQKIKKVDEAAERRRKERERQQAEAEAKAKQQAEARAAQEEWKEKNRDKLEELKRDYYLRKARRERWEQFRESNRSRAFSDYYKGWDLFEEDPDEDLFSGDNPAAVQDQAAFDAMAKDVEARTKERRGKKAAADKEKESGNAAFKAGQHAEAIAAYSRAIEFFKGDKAVFCNRALAHLRQRNFMSALEDCNRAIEISKFLDDDFDRRPPPPPLLKAYVRRSSAHAELGHLHDASTDLETAAAMAAGLPAELEEIKRLKRTLQQDVAAATREHEAEGGVGSQETRGRVKELLEALEAPGKAAAALAELGTLLRDSVACRIALRQAGGVRQLLVLMGGGEAAEVAALLCLACLERRNQLELHLCGGVTQILRELRRVVPPAGDAAPPPDARASAALTPQLHLLALACHHEKVRAEAKRLAIGEGALERLVLLLTPDVTPPLLSRAVGAAALLATLTSGRGGKETLVAHRASLVGALARHVASPHPPLAEHAATALGHLSVHPKLRVEMAGGGALAALLALLHAPHAAAAADALLPNALAALHNCSLHPAALEAMASVATARALLPHVRGRAPLARRAAALLSRCATARREVAAELAAAGGGVEAVARLLVDEAAAMGRAEEGAAKAKAAREAAAKAKAEAQFAKTGGGAKAEAEAEAEEAKEEGEAGEEEGEEMMVGALVRIVAACAPHGGAARATCTAGALPVLVALLRRPSPLLQGNAALAIAECARDEVCLAVLAVQPVVPPLLAIAHEGKGQPQKNAAIALGRLSKNQHCLHAIRENHGIEILARAMKGKMAF
ncbi:hypothetical protein AB1Y20_023548 [Prymnesium parvum]|uniref:Protein unc-45 homolog B n=1 Tax=Prymnesium parvum TaxID=97485 RepID=A0AB34JGL0_PRYPA